MGKAVARPPRTKAARFADAQRALELHLSGLPTPAICEELHISRRTLYRWIEWAMSVRIDPTVEQYRAQATYRIGMLRAAALDTLRQVPTTTRTLLDPETGEAVRLPADPAAVARLIDTLDRLEDREARIRGGYAPTRVDVTVAQADAWSALEAELAKAEAAPAPSSSTPA